MGLRRRLRAGLEPILGALRLLPPGVNLFADLKVRLPHYRATLVFDVGAYVGDTARRYLRAFPQARIYCFEPTPETYAALCRSLGAEPRVRCVNLALSSAPGTGAIVCESTPDCFYLDGAGRRRFDHSDAPRAPVQVETVDRFCAAEGITHISYLKIDTEGVDLDVLCGAESMLRAGRIDLVEVEAGLYPGNTWHVPLEEMKAFLEARGYFLFGLYEQFPEWSTGEPHLRRANAVFISPATIRANRWPV
ncbi:MAG: FkbM family methyltransferase [Oscillochloridaceae bacterium]|nr:FkbM family methyltransferase [Chloroflexaceae bacterium]MDW8389368.1 FkbM family methyltransferase [Oscillochloridaceae bacterium]